MCGRGIDVVPCTDGCRALEGRTGDESSVRATGTDEAAQAPLGRGYRRREVVVMADEHSSFWATFPGILTGVAVKGHEDLPSGGRETCPLTVTHSAR